MVQQLTEKEAKDMLVEVASKSPGLLFNIVEQVKSNDGIYCLFITINDRI